MPAKTYQGLFEVIDSFAIRRKNQFYLIGLLKEGTVQENWFVNIPLNGSLSLTVRISEIEQVVMSTDTTIYMLISINTNDEGMMDMLISLGIGPELLEITIEGVDYN